jgi:hypothetical protein
MGEYADMILEGLIDEETGELIDGQSPGYPRSPTRERRKALKRAKEGGKPFRCPTCGKHFKTKEACDQHCRDKHGANP